MLSPVVSRAGVVGCLLLVLLTGGRSALAWDDPPEAKNTRMFHVSERRSQLSLTEKESRLIELDARIKSVDNFDPTVVKITTVDNFHQVRLLAVAPGFTTVTVVDEHGQSYSIELLISGDVKQLEAVIRKASPGSSVQALKVKDNVLLLGWVDQPGEATKIVELAEQFHPKVLNYLQVSGVQTIMLRVRMMEAQRSKIRSLGFNFLQLRDHSYVGSLPGTIAPFSNSNPVTNLGNPLGAFLGPVTSAVNPAQATAVFGLVSNDNAFQGFIEALKQENLLTILSEPTLITTNGRPASFLSGGQFPVPVPQGLGTVSVVYKPFGVQLDFVPTVIGSGRLRMQVRPEVSERDFSNVLNINGITVPSLTTRSVNTEVEMNFGETLIIAGLIQNRVQASTHKVPFLGELPWLGTAFRRVKHDETETELLVLVTPELAAPTDESCLPDGPGRGTVSPTDRELFFNGYLETPRYAPDPEPDVSQYSSGFFGVSGHTPTSGPVVPPRSHSEPSVIPPEPAPVLDVAPPSRPLDSGAPVPQPASDAFPETLPPAGGVETDGIAPTSATMSRRMPLRKGTGKSKSASAVTPASASTLADVPADRKKTTKKSSSAKSRPEGRPGLIAP